MIYPTRATKLTSFLLCMLAIKVATAQETLSTLYIPGFDDQPLSAIPLGVDAQGRTTYEIVQGSLTGSFDAPSFPATATLVEGGDEAFVTMDLGGVGVSISCSVAGSTANCVGFDGTETITYTEDAAPITVQIDPAVTPTTAAGADGAGTTPTTGNGSPTSPTPGGTTSGDAPGPTGTNNNSAGRAATTLGWVVSACLVLAVMLH